MTEDDERDRTVDRSDAEHRESDRASRPSVAAAPEQPSAISADAVRDYLARADARAIIAAIVARRTPPQDCQDVEGAIHVAVLTAPRRPSTEAALPAWVSAIAHHTIANRFRKRERRGKYEGDLAELGVDADQAAAPEGTRGGAPLLEWLEDAVSGHPGDRETLALLCERAGTDSTYAAAATAHGMTETALKKRVLRFTEKYRERAERRNRALLILLLLGAALAAYAIWRARTAPQVGPVNEKRAPSASPAPTRDLVAHPPPGPPEPAPSDTPREP